MPMRWRKLARVFCPDGEYPWMRSHAANPVAVPVVDTLFRIYFSTRDAQNRSSIAWIELDLREPGRVLRVTDHPVLQPGETGCFDDSGCSIGCILRRNRQCWLYYMGWNLGVTVPWRNAIGLAISDDGERFERVSRAPVMDRSDADPFTLSYPWVIEDGGRYRMWYGSNLRWGRERSDMDHVIKHASSSDGRTWDRDGRAVILPCDSTEYAFARPCVVRDADAYHMWYAYRGEAYRLGYATSGDGTAWARKDAMVGIDVSPGDWDGASIEYPCVFDHAGQRYLLYCGDDYGRTGFGIAVRE
jgi:hypothetical protein